MAGRQGPRLEIREDDGAPDTSNNTYGTYLSLPNSPTNTRRPTMSRRPSTGDGPDERSPLLTGSRTSRIRIHSAHGSPRVPILSRNQSYADSVKSTRHHSRANSWGSRLMNAFSDRQNNDRPDLADSHGSLFFPDDRVWYDQFTSTDWVHDTIADSYRQKALRSRKDFWGRVYLLFDGAQGWILSALVGFVVAVLAYVINVSEATVFDFKDGYCRRGWFISEKKCCPHGPCTDWRDWGEVLQGWPFGERWTEYAVYIAAVITLACLSCLLTLTTKTVVPSAYRLSTLDENLAADPATPPDSDAGTETSPVRSSPIVPKEHPAASPPMIYYSAAGSGVAEVRVILSGFVLHGFLGLKTLIIKSMGLILSVASGLSLGKEGPYVHIATCVGNIACRLFSKYDRNDAKRREVLSAAAAAGVAVAFGAPLGGVLFGLEEVAYFFPAKTLFRTFFCCITAALTLKFLNPYGTHKIVMFQVRYLVDWEYFEILSFIIVGVLGGAAGALFIKASRRWAKTFRKIPMIKKYPMLEVMLVALVTGLVSYWNVFTKLPVAKLLYNLAAPCDDRDQNLEDLGLCPTEKGDIPPALANLLAAFLIKGLLTIITFGIVSPFSPPPPPLPPFFSC